MAFLNKVVLVTGAGSGAGEGVATHFAKLSARLALVDVDGGAVMRVAETCQKISRVNVLKITANLRNDEEVQRAVEAAVREYGRLDVLVNVSGAAGSGARTGDAHALETFDRIMSVTVRAVVAVTHRAAPALLESRGCIVNLSSVAGVLPLPHVTAYSVSQAALSHLTRCVALELAPRGVRVNTVMVGYAKNDLVGGERHAALWRDAPLKRLVGTDEVSELVSYLAGERAASVTGACYIVDAGVTLAGNTASSDLD